MEAGEATGPLSPQEEVCMHLTNYAINKHNENFVRDDTVGSKRYSLLGFLPLSLSPAVMAACETETGSREADGSGKVNLQTLVLCSPSPTLVTKPSSRQ